MKKTTNSDLGSEFLAIYNETRNMLRKILGVNKDFVYVLTGEALLGLEVSIANTVKNDTKVLVIAN